MGAEMTTNVILDGKLIRVTASLETGKEIVCEDCRKIFRPFEVCEILEAFDEEGEEIEDERLIEAFNKRLRKCPFCNREEV